MRSWASRVTGLEFLGCTVPMQACMCACAWAILLQAGVRQASQTRQGMWGAVDCCGRPALLAPKGTLLSMRLPFLHPLETTARRRRAGQDKARQGKARRGRTKDRTRHGRVATRAAPPSPRLSHAQHPPGAIMVSFSCEVCLVSSTVLCSCPLCSPMCLQLEAYCRVLELWGCPHQEKAGRPPQPVLWRLLHLPRLHGPFPWNELQVPHGMSSHVLNSCTRLLLPFCDCSFLFATAPSSLRSLLPRCDVLAPASPIHQNPASTPNPQPSTRCVQRPLTSAPRPASQKTKSIRASSTRRRSQGAASSSTTTTSTSTRRPSPPTMHTFKTRPKPTTPSPSSMPLLARLPHRPRRIPLDTMSERRSRLSMSLTFLMSLQLPGQRTSRA